MITKPNLFTHGTGELTQDAFICWLLSWAAPEYEKVDKELHATATKIIEQIFQKHHKKIPNTIETISIKKQDEKLDILLVINETYAILIEDKTFTSEHSNQLKNYLSVMEGRYGEKFCLPIYWKIGNQSNYSSVHEAGYQRLTREEILGILAQGIKSGIQNNIYIDYYHYLFEINEKYKSFSTVFPTDWSSLAWEGFYTELQKHIKGNWGYVPNHSGGFMGFWWGGRKHEDFNIYLQLEQVNTGTSQYGKLCIKVKVPEKDNIRRVRKECFEKVKTESEKYNVKIRKPNRFGHGRTMTIAILKKDFRATDSSLIDIDKTVKLMKSVEKVIAFK